MKYIWFLCCLPFCLIGQGDNWSRELLPRHECSLYIPTDLEEKTATINTSIGKLNVFTSYCESLKEDPNELYLINSMQYPPNYLHVDSLELIQALVDEMVAELALSLDGHLDYQSALEEGMWKKSVFRISYNQGHAVCKGKAYIVRDKLHLLQVFVKAENSLNDEADKFLESFNPYFDKKQYESND